MSYYNQGRLVESYTVFERITKIQPGDTRVQKYMSQLKDEIANSYFTAGNKSFNAQKYDSAISYWTNAKKWGADASYMDRLIKKARNAKEEALRRKQEAARRAAEEAEKAEEEQLDEPIETVTVDGGLGVPGEGAPTLGPDGNTVTQGIGGGATRVSAEASAASRQKYIEGLDAFNQDDYERARAAWIVAKQLDPGNTDADLGLRKVEELTGIR